MDNFSIYGLTEANLTNGVYAQADGCTLVVDPDGEAVDSIVIRQTTTTNGRSVLRRVLSGARTIVGVAVRLWMNELPENTTASSEIAVSDLNNLEHCWVTVNPSGYLVAFREDQAGRVQLGISDGPVAVANAWQHYEVKFNLHASAGYIKVKVNGALLMDLTGIRTVSDKAAAIASAHNVRLSHRNNTTDLQTHWKDLIIWDDQGAKNNDFMGQCQVYKIVPEADVSLGWTPNTGALGWTLVDEDDPDDDTQYISADSTLPPLSQFVMTDLPVDVTAVKSVMSIHRSRKTDNGDGKVQTGLVYSGNTALGVDRDITTAYTFWTDVHDDSPDGGNWSKSKVDALEMIIDRTL